MSAVVRTRLAALLIVALLHPAGEAAAQGGAYRGPRGVAPDSIRDWRRSRPPPPPPPASVPEGGPSRRSEGIGPDDWTFWYHHENEPFEELKDALYHRVGSSPLQALGAPHDPTHGTTADIRTLVRTRVAPVLAQMILDPATDPRLRRAASLALGKTSTKTAHVALLLEALTPTTSRPDAPSWESALALGLLRRERPAERMAPRDLKRVREVLLTTVGGEAGPDLVRGAAALALGLLADQGAEDAAHVAPRLAEVLEQDDAAPDLRVACLVALGLHPRAAIDERILQRIRVRAAANGERVRHQPRIVAVYAVLALGRLGDAADVDLLLRTALFSRRGMPRRNESAAIALGALAARVDEDTRRRIHEALRKALTKQPHRSSPGFALISQGRIALAALRASPPQSVLAEQAVAGLRARLETGGRRARPFACLALARIARTIGSNEDDESLRDMRERILQVLRRNLMSKRLGERERAAVALALGLAQDEDRAEALHELAASPSSPPPIAAYAALGHGLLGSGTKATHRTLRGLVDPRQPRVVRHQAARALGLLHDRDVGARVRSALAAADSEPVKHELLVTLAEVGTETDVEPLLAYVLDAERDPAMRARACAALGRVSDLERVPSVTRLVNGMNHRAATLLMAQVWDLQ